VSKLAFGLTFLLIAASGYAANITGMKAYGSTEHISVFVQDDRDYTPLMESLESNYIRIRNELNPGFNKKVKVYIYPDQLRFVKAVFNWTKVEMAVAGLADNVNNALYITSIYDTCKPAEHMQRMPIHELTHVIFPQPIVWVREGIANYEAGLLTSFEIGTLPKRIPDLVFNKGDELMLKSYNYSGWIVKYIVDVLLEGKVQKFGEYVKKSIDKNGRIQPNESKFFVDWNLYMSEKARGT
jgi:hypothetical protein